MNFLKTSGRPRGRQIDIIEAGNTEDEKSDGCEYADRIDASVGGNFSPHVGMEMDIPERLEKKAEGSSHGF